MSATASSDSEAPRGLPGRQRMSDSATHPAQRARERRQRRVRPSLGAHGLTEAGHDVLDDASDRLRCAVPGTQPGAPGGDHEACSTVRSGRHDPCDVARLVGHDAALHDVAEIGQPRLDDIATGVVARAGHHAVTDGHDDGAWGRREPRVHLARGPGACVTHGVRDHVARGRRTRAPGGTDGPDGSPGAPSDHLGRRPSPVAALAAALLHEPDAVDGHEAVGRLDHVVDGQGGHRDRRHGLHLHAGLGRRGAAGGDDQRAGLAVGRDLDGDLRQRQGMAERDELRRALGGHDAGQLGHAEHVTLGTGAIDDQGERLLVHLDGRLSDGAAERGRRVASRRPCAGGPAGPRA